jgi:hypothetical protein
MKALLPGKYFEKSRPILRARSKRVRGAFSATQLGDTLLTVKPLKDNADLLFGGKLAARAATNFAHCGFSGLLSFFAHIETLLGFRNPMKCLFA